MSSTEPPGDRGLLDTSIFIARESGRPLDRSRIPAFGSVSVMTIAELRVGVILATDSTERIRRLSSYTKALELEPLPVDEGVADAWAELRARLAATSTRMHVNDSWIAATAIAHGIPVVTQDGDFADGLGFDVIRI